MTSWFTSVMGLIEEAGIDRADLTHVAEACAEVAPDTEDYDKRLPADLRSAVEEYVGEYPGMEGIRFRDGFEAVVRGHWGMMLMMAKRELGLDKDGA